MGWRQCRVLNSVNSIWKSTSGGLLRSACYVESTSTSEKARFIAEKLVKRVKKLEKVISL